MSAAFVVETYSRRPRKLPRKDIEIRKELHPETHTSYCYRAFTSAGEDLKIFALSFAQALALVKRTFTVGAVKLTCR